MKYKFITLSFLVLLCIGFAAANLSDNETAYCSTRTDLTNISDCASFWATMHSINPVNQQAYNLNMSGYVTSDQFSNFTSRFGNFTNGTFFLGNYSWTGNYSNYTGNFTIQDCIIAARDSGIFQLTANVPAQTQQNLSYQQQSQNYNSNPNYATQQTTSSESPLIWVILILVVILVIVVVYLVAKGKTPNVNPRSKYYPIEDSGMYEEGYVPRIKKAVSKPSIEELEEARDKLAARDEKEFAEDKEQLRKRK